MADFFDSEAEVSDDEDIKLSSDEEDEEEGEGENENLDDLINDEDEEEDQRGSDSEGEIGKKKKRKRREIDDRLEDDDYELIEENTGFKVDRKKFRRLRQISDEEDSEDEEGISGPQAEATQRDAIAKEIFQDDIEGEDDEPPEEGEIREPAPEHDQYAEIESDEEESDPDDFIVDDEGQPIARRKKKGHKSHRYTDSALQEAQDIFGLDFDFEEFNQYGEDYEEALEEDSEYEDEEEDVDLGDEGPRRVRKTGKKRTSKKSIYDVFEPSDLERGHFTDIDNEIRATDIPERLQLRRVPVTKADDAELDEEADWIYRQAFLTPPVSNQEYSEQDSGYGSGYERKPPRTKNRIREALHFMRNQHFEVPFIAFYRKEYVEPELNFNDLYRVYHWDEKWCQLKNRKANLKKLFEKMQAYQFDQMSTEELLPDSVRPLTETDLDRLNDVDSMDKLKDVYMHFLLYYGRDIPKMHNALKKSKKKTGRTKLVRRPAKKMVKVMVRRPKMKKPKENEDDDSDDDKDWTEEDAKKDEESDSEEEEVETEEEVDTEEEVEVEVDEDGNEQTEDGTSHQIKQATRKSMYAICQEAGLDALAKKFGLTPEQFGENLRDNYQRYDPEQHPVEPAETAKDFIGSKFQSEESVMKAACYMVALQLAHDPLVRQCVRQTYYERAKISIRPTKKGMKEIDETHPSYGCKYLKNKPVKDLFGDKYLKLLQAEDEKLLKITMDIDLDKSSDSSYQSQSYFEDIKQLYYRDEFSHTVQEWNKERSAAIETALYKILYPEMAKELKSRLVQEAKEGIIKMCCRKMFDWLKVMPFQADQQLEEDEDDYLDGQGHVGLRVMGLAFTSEMDNAAFCVLIDGDGEVVDFLRLPHLLRRTNSYYQRDRELKQADMEALKEFLSSKKPHVVAVASESRVTLGVIKDVQQCVSDLEAEQQIAPISVQLVDSNVAQVYSATNMAESEFRKYPQLLRQAISVARRLQDPMVELARLCNSDEDLMCLKFHPMQDSVSREELQEALHQEFIYRVNEVGVDINRAMAHAHSQSLVQFICGLGPRKGHSILRTLKQQNQRLENRNQLVTVCKLGPKVFINCAGFIRIDTASLGDSSDSYIEVLDSTRIHNETYEWARKMAVDALEYDESADDANPAEALEEILDNPDKLKDLDLDAFAEELERQGYGNKSITLYDIRAELNNRYKDLRTPYHPASAEETFSMLTKETPDTFYRGKMVLCTVTGIARRRPQKDQLDQANPVRNDETGLWQCPFCQQDNFPELSEVWSHFDGGDCPGRSVGVRTRLDNGIAGFIPTKMISDKQVNSPEERVKVGMTLHCRITKIEIEHFRVDLTSRSSDLQDKSGEFAPPRDTFFDHTLYEKDQRKDEESKKKVAQAYTKRVIVHPSFHNITFKDAEKLLVNMDLGEVVIRPSSKGSDHLTTTWKVDEGIYAHIDVREEGKENAFSLGTSLWIGSEEFEDLDEIIARHVQPMAAYVRDTMQHKYYRDTEGGKRDAMEKVISAEKRKQPSRIPYFMSFSKEYPGKFLLSYQPRSKVRHEYVTITPEGYRYRGQIHQSINALHRWFKEHFRDPIPGVTPASIHRTPMVAAPERTPAVYSYMGTPMIQKM
ncbi:transcription elongation factor SPT6-like isoform X2 [Patiria miniata]|uniref:Transcription elongation factor SPT6 n=1 Tax=Patiria miniata TaxID=46514 RepID=A0A914BHH6_PATMI|nr:transcription elongation factor SPT6-like isoform X2 [Patiria miniata]